MLSRNRTTNQQEEKSQVKAFNKESY